MKHNRPSHPADLAARVELAREFWKVRTDAGLSLAAFAEQMVTHPALVWRIERLDDPNPAVRTLNRYGAVMGMRLAMTLPDAEIPEPGYHGPRPGGYMVEWLRAVRVHRSLSRGQVARQGGWTVRAFRGIENGDQGLWLSTIQRYGRALDCPVKVWWEPC